jgi:tRNA threonylcarbamoyladenosine biosynthesis protein TsaB
MLILALDTASKTISVALLRESEILCEFSLHSFSHHSENILPAIGSVLSYSGQRIEDVDLFAVTLGPGSFTGLRICASTIKGLTLSTGKPAVGLSTLEALAFNVMASDFVICPMLDARRNEVYTGLYRNGTSGRLELIEEEQVTDPRVFLRRQSREMLFLGDGAQAYREVIESCSRATPHFAPPHLQGIRASAVGLLGFQKFCQGETLDMLTFTPRYLRLSQAEVRAV